jgi:hypothetical protein
MAGAGEARAAEIPREAMHLLEGRNFAHVATLMEDGSRRCVVEIGEEGADEHIDALAKRYLGADEYPARQPGEVRLIVRVKPERVRHNAP